MISIRFNISYWGTVSSQYNRTWNQSASFRLTQWLKIIPHIIRSYYHCCCINEPVIFSQCVHLKLGHRFHALLKDCSNREYILIETLSYFTTFSSRNNYYNYRKPLLLHFGVKFAFMFSPKCQHARRNNLSECLVPFPTYSQARFRE